MPVANELQQAPDNQVATVLRPSSPLPAPNAAKPGDAINLWVRDDGGQMKRVRVPLVDANTLDNSTARCFKPACRMMSAIS